MAQVFTSVKPQDLDQLAQDQSLGHFLQTNDWAVFQERVGHEVLCLGLGEAGKLQASAVVIKKRIWGFPYWYIPRGPLVSSQQNQTSAEQKALWPTCLQQLKVLAQQNRAKFVRLEPEHLEPAIAEQLVPTLTVQPSQTIFLDLTQSTSQLQAKMHQKTRYNIRLAQKKGVVIEKASAQDWPLAWPIMQATQERDNFGLHDQCYYQQLLEQPNASLLLAKYQGQIIACGIFWRFGQAMTYLHGGSSNADRNVMAPYLLQWQAILLAQEQGCRYYDFYGIDSQKWPGVTRFKQGFGGTVITYPGTFDLICSPLYYGIYKIVRKIRRWF